jgi:hypothetical protein
MNPMGCPWDIIDKQHVPTTTVKGVIEATISNMWDS